MSRVTIKDKTFETSIPEAEILERVKLVADVLEEISAKAPEDGKPCVTYIGPDGAGHYVKSIRSSCRNDGSTLRTKWNVDKRSMTLSASSLATYK